MQLRVCKWFYPFALFTMWGCGSSEPKLPELVPVTGTVTYDGKPLADATVTFSPMGTTQEGPGAGGVTDASGKYTLETLAQNGKSKTGAVPGKYGVRISRMILPDGSVWKPDPKVDSGPATFGASEELPPEYSLQPRLTADVSKEKSVHDFKLEKKSGNFDAILKPDQK